MEIWLLRHAVAEDRAASGDDADRALTPEGRRRAQSVARSLGRLEPEIQRVLTSPYRRARETAEPAAQALGLGDALRETSALEPTADPESILEELRAEPLRGALLVGHQPHLGDLLGLLVARRAKMEFHLRKASLAWVTWDGREAGELRALIPAKVLERLAGRPQGISAPPSDLR